MAFARRCYIAASATLVKAKSPPPPHPLPPAPSTHTSLSLSLSLGPNPSASCSPRKKQYQKEEEEQFEKRRSLSSLLLPLPSPSPTSVSLSLSLGPSSPRNRYQLNDVIVSPEIVFDGEEISNDNNNKQGDNVDVVVPSSSMEIKVADEEISRAPIFNNNLLDQRKLSGTGLGELLFLEDCLKPFKKREYNHLVDKKKKRKRTHDEDSCKQLLLPFKKRRSFFVADNNNNNNNDVLIFKMEKSLTKSDVNSSSRLLLGNKEKIGKLLSNMELSGDEECFQDPTRGMEIDVYDSDTKKKTTMVLRKWVTQSFVLNNGWRDKIVKTRNLQKGDVIQLQWDQSMKRLNFRLCKT